MSNVKTGTDILKATLSKAGETYSGNSRFLAEALDAINQAYLAILGGSNEWNLDIGDPWVWARESTPKTIILQPPYEDGSVVLANGSTSGTFTTIPSDSKDKWFLSIPGRPEMYRITHTAGQAAFTLDCEFLGNSGTQEYSLIKLIYDLGAGILRLVEPFRAYTPINGFGKDGSVFGIDVGTFRKNYPLIDLESGMPTHFAVVQESANNFYVQFNKYVLDKIKIDIDYIKIPAPIANNALEPIIPVKHRMALVYMAASMLLDEKDDERFASVYKIAEKKLRAMQIQKNNVDQHTGGMFRGRLIARRDLLK